MNWLTAGYLILGLGTCDPTVDFCPDPVGKIAADMTIVESDSQTHSIHLGVEHFSRIGDGELRGEGDRGTELFMLEYHYKLF